MIDPQWRDVKVLVADLRVDAAAEPVRSAARRSLCESLFLLLRVPQIPIFRETRRHFGESQLNSFFLVRGRRYFLEDL